MGKNAPKNSPLRKVNQRRKNSIERLEARLKLSNERLFQTAKCFRQTSLKDVPQKEFNKYREYLKTVLENTKRKVSA